MTFGELVEGLGAKLGVEIEDAGGAAALEIDGETDTFEDSRTRLITDVFSITSNELKTGWFAGEATRVKAVKDDALKMAGDNSYQIDIGV